jgi:hypothetical protein
MKTGLPSEPSALSKCGTARKASTNIHVKRIKITEFMTSYRQPFDLAQAIMKIGGSVSENVT